MERDPNMQGRRAASRATKLRRRKARMNFILLAGFIALVVLLVMFTPKEPTLRAVYSNATESGLVEETGNEQLDAYAGLVISEVMPSNNTAVTDENGKYGDWIEIWNSGDQPVNLEHLGLSDRSDRIRFLFPAVRLEPDGRTVVFCDNTNQTSVNRPFHAKFKLSSVGETVFLFSPDAYLIDSCKYSVMASDESWALTEDGFRSVPYYSPGYENTEEGNRRYRESISVSDGSVVINEIMADPISGLRDDDDELCDWVELYNTTDRDIPLANLGLSDNEGKPLKWRFPDDAVIPAKGYYLVFCTGKDRMDRVKSVPHTNFRISAEREAIILSDSQGRVIDRVMIDNLPLDCSWGRNEAGQMQVFKMATPALPNSQTGFNQMDINLRALNKTHVYISEVMASNDLVVTYPNKGNTDWIELYNSGTETQDLSGWGLSDRLDRGRRWQFPQGTVINPGEYKVVMCDGTITGTSAQEPHAAFKVGKLKQETITLTDPTGRVLDKIDLPEMKTDVSYGRTLGMAGLFYYDTPTPFQQNGQGFSGFTEMPSFTVEPGMFYSTTYVQFNIPEGTQVYYTNDGNIPTENSIPYEEGQKVEVKFTSVLRARAYSAGNKRPSDVLTGTFFINIGHTLPVVSITADRDVLFNKETGILVTGDDVVKVPGKLPFKNTIYRKIKDSGQMFECYVEMYDDSGNKIISQGAAFALMGSYSLDMPQKSFKFRAKSKYGPKTCEAQLFPDRPYTEYKTFVLRNSGNDSMWTRLADGFQSRLMDYVGTSVAHQAWKPYAVYLDGQYWGHMNLREKADRFLIAQFEGLTLDEADNMVIMEGSGKRAKYGTKEDANAYQAMVKKIKNSDPEKNPEDRQYILDNIDVDNFFEYMAFEMYFGNSDIGNTRYYRLKKEGSKWKWLLYDVDYGLFNSNFNSPKSYMKPQGMGDQKIDNTIFRKLMSVPEFKDRFMTIYGNIFKKLSGKVMVDGREKNAMMAILDDLVELIRPEMKHHWDLWGELNDKNVIEEVPVTADGAYRYWEKRVERLRNVIRKRPTLLWQFTQDVFNLSNEEMEKYFGPKPEMPPEAV